MLTDVSRCRAARPTTLVLHAVPAVFVADGLQLGCCGVRLLVFTALAVRDLFSLTLVSCSIQGFTTFNSYIKAKNWSAAANDLKSTLWCKQVRLYAVFRYTRRAVCVAERIPMHRSAPAALVTLASSLAVARSKASHVAVWLRNVTQKSFSSSFVNLLILAFNSLRFVWYW